MDFFADILFSIIGSIYLRIRYKNKDRRKFIIDNKYAGSSRNAGSIICINFFGIIFGILLLALVIMLIYRGILNLIE